MNILKIMLIPVLVLLGAMASGTAFAHGGHVRLGIYLGGPVYSPYYYPAPRYYYPPSYYYPPTYYNPPVVVAPVPPVYVEQSVAPPQPQQQQSSANYWYYCADSKTYYPYVQKCASSWQRVSPQPPS